MKIKLFDVLKILIGIAIFAFLINNVGMEKIIAAFSKFNPAYLIPYALMHFISFFTAAFNVKLLADAIKKLDFKKIFHYNILSWSFGQFVPAKLGEFSIIYYFKKEGIKISDGLAISFLDKIITTLAVAFIALMGVLAYFRMSFLASIIILVAYFSAIAFGFLLLSKKPVYLLKRHILRGFFSKFSGFIDVVAGYFSNRKDILLINTGVTFLKWGIMAIGGYFLFLGFGHEVSFVDVLLINSIGTMVALIPISLAGLGIRESVTVLLFSQLGVPPEIALSVALIQLIINYATAIGVLSFARIK